MDDIYVVEQHYVKGGEGVSDKIHWRGKYEIKEYSLNEFRYIDTKNPFNNIDRNSLNLWEQIALSVEEKMWEEFNDKFIYNVNNKHPSTYRSNVKKLSK